MNQDLEKLPTTVNNDSAFYAQMDEDGELSEFELEMVAAGCVGGVTFCSVHF
jgi:hypothetical protein